jgi:MoaA/NifB/PqqE/SkfB family radical SAM enzyme
MKFRKTYIEITNQCNLSCGFCPKTSRKPLFMDDALFDSVCKQLTGLSEQLFFHVMGEPLLHPRLPAFLDICESYGHRVHVVTNGLLLAKLCTTLAAKPALRQLNVSLHSCAGQSNGADLRTVLAAVKLFIDTTAEGPGPIVQLRLWNKGAADPAFQRAALGFIEETFNLPHSIEERLSVRRSFMLGERLCIDSTEPFEWPSIDNKDYGGRGTCYGLRKQCAVLADGAVTACCLDNNGILNLGNAGERSLSDILSGDRARAIREGFERGFIAEELCRKCSYRLRFKGGKGRALVTPHSCKP